MKLTRFILLKQNNHNYFVCQFQLCSKEKNVKFFQISEINLQSSLALQYKQLIIFFLCQMDLVVLIVLG